MMRLKECYAALKLTLTLPENMATVTVAMASEIMESIRENGSTGLGLGIVKSLLQNHGGDIWLVGVITSKI